MRSLETTIQGMLVSQRTRRAALGTAGVFAADALLSAHGFPPVSAQEGTPSAATVEEYPEAVIAAGDFSFELPASVPGGLTRITLQNDGAVDHHAMFMRLNDDVSLDDFEGLLTTPDMAPILAASESLGGPEVGPGLQATAIADLTPGQYMVICAIPDMDGTPHYMMGMYAPLQVEEPVAAATPPTADVTVELVDFAFTMPEMAISAGPQVWAAPNVGEQVHEMVILQMAPGFTVEQAVAIFETFPEPGQPAPAMASPPAMTGPPPMTIVGGVAPMIPGYSAWAVLDLEPGEYLAICFVPDPASGSPHFALGMLMPFTVG